MTLLSLLHPLISPDYVSWPKVFPSCWSSLVFTLLKVMLIIALLFLTEPLLTSTYTVLHMFRQVLFWAGNQGNHQNFEKSLLTNKL